MNPALDVTLAESLAALGLDLPETARRALLAYLQLLLRWNATYNLTAVREPDQMLVQHLVDCLAVVTPLRRHLRGASARLLDVGSGGGLPGVVIAIAAPEIHVTCVDTVGKKAAFVRQVAAELGLGGLRAEHARVERLQGAYDVIASRAFASLRQFCALTRQCLAPDGVWMAMKGRSPHDEIDQLPSDVSVFHVEQLQIPGLAAERCLIWMAPSNARHVA